jgi:hypothetical protein
MAKKTKPKEKDEAQSKRFIDAAKELGADETKEGADRAFKKVISSPPKGKSNRG